MDILQRDRLLKFGSVPFTTDVIAGEFGDYSAVLAKDVGLEKGESEPILDCVVESCRNLK